jgi:hypothetical protein
LGGGELIHFRGFSLIPFNTAGLAGGGQSMAKNLWGTIGALLSAFP